jgi:hypothetical protein
MGDIWQSLIGQQNASNALNAYNQALSQQYMGMLNDPYDVSQYQNFIGAGTVTEKVDKLLPQVTAPEHAWLDRRIDEISFKG